MTNRSQMCKNVCAMHMYSDWASVLHTTVGGWAQDVSGKHSPRCALFNAHRGLKLCEAVLKHPVSYISVMLRHPVGYVKLCWNILQATSVFLLRHPVSYISFCWDILQAIEAVLKHCKLCQGVLKHPVSKLCQAVLKHPVSYVKLCWNIL